MSMVIFPAMFFFSISQVDCAVRQRMCITHQMTERESQSFQWCDPAEICCAIGRLTMRTNLAVELFSAEDSKIHICKDAAVMQSEEIGANHIANRRNGNRKKNEDENTNIVIDIGLYYISGKKMMFCKFIGWLYEYVANPTDDVHICFVFAIVMVSKFNEYKTFSYLMIIKWVCFEKMRKKKRSIYFIREMKDDTKNNNLKLPHFRAK